MSTLRLFGHDGDGVSRLVETEADMREMVRQARKWAELAKPLGGYPKPWPDERRR